MKIEFTCEQCGVAGLTHPYPSKRKRFCSRPCSARFTAANRRDYTGPDNPRWRGGRQIDKDGYVLLYRPDHPHAEHHGYVREHRLVMEAVLGRYLTPEEVVHHKEDGVESRQNNDPSNLFLYSSNGEHLSDTRAGKMPLWTPDGLARLKASDFGRGKVTDTVPLDPRAIGAGWEKG